MIVSSALVVVVIALAWYLLVERPSVERRAEATRLARSIQVGDHVMTSDGMVVVVLRIDGRHLLARMLSGTQIVVDVDSVLDRAAVTGAPAHGGSGVSALDREYAATTAKWFGAGATGATRRAAPAS